MLNSILPRFLSANWVFTQYFTAKNAEQDEIGAYEWLVYIFWEMNFGEVYRRGNAEGNAQETNFIIIREIVH